MRDNSHVACDSYPFLVFRATLPVGLCPAGHDGERGREGRRGEGQLSFTPKEGRKEGRRTGETKTGKRDLNKRKNDAERGGDSRAG